MTPVDPNATSVARTIWMLAEERQRLADIGRRTRVAASGAYRMTAAPPKIEESYRNRLPITNEKKLGFADAIDSETDVAGL